MLRSLVGSEMCIRDSTMVEWGLIANWIANPWFTALAVILIVLIGLSRIYLGVHFPTDVLAGWALAGLILLLHIRYAERIATRLASLALGVQIAAAAAVSLLFVLVYALVLQDRYLVGVAGLFFGAGSGIALCRRYLLSLIHISEPTRLLSISYAVFCLKKKKPHRILHC